MQKQKTIKTNLFHDAYWGPLLFIFSQVHGLKKFLTTQYIDIENEILEVDALLKDRVYLSSSEKALLNLGLHLYNSSFDFKMDELDRLDSKNIEIAFEAMKRRFY